MANLSIFNSTKFWIIFIFLLSSIFRIFFLDLIEFKYDEAIVTFQIFDFYEHPYLIESGPASATTNIGTPALGMDIFALFSLLSQHPQAISFFTALANSLIVVIFYLFSRNLYGNTVAIISSLIFATSPAAILYSRKISTPNLVILFAVPISYFASKILLAAKPLQKKLSKDYFWLFFFLALPMQVHQSGAVLLVATILVLLILRVSFDIKSAIKGFLVGLIPLIPFILRQFKSNPFCIDCQALFSYHVSGQADRPFPFSIFKIPFFIDRNVSGVLGNDYLKFIQEFPLLNILNYIFTFEGVLIILSLLYILVRNRRYLYLPVFFIVTSSLYFLGKSNAYDYYFLIIYPFLIISLALTFKSVFSSQKQIFKYLKIPLIVLLAAIIFSNITFEIFFYKFISQKKVIDGGYGQIFPITEEYVNTKTLKYSLLPDYQRIKFYAYILANNRELHPKINDEAMHVKLGEYFAQTGRLKLAIEELENAIKINPDNLSTKELLIKIKNLK